MSELGAEIKTNQVKLSPELLKEFGEFSKGDFQLGKGMTTRKGKIIITVDTNNPDDSSYSKELEEINKQIAPENGKPSEEAIEKHRKATESLGRRIFYKRENFVKDNERDLRTRLRTGTKLDELPADTSRHNKLVKFTDHLFSSGALEIQRVSATPASPAPAAK